MRVPLVFATRQSFAGELTAPAGRNLRPPISAGCRRASLLCGLRCALAEKCLAHASTLRKRTFAACPWGRAADCEREIRLAGLRKGGGQFASPSPLVFAARLQKCLAPERFCLPFCPLPGVAACKTVVFFAAALYLSGGVVSPAEVARGTFPRRTGKGAGSVCFVLLNVPGRSRCSSSPGSFGLSSVPCSLPQRNWRALRVSACVLAARRTQGHQKGRKDWLSGPV